MGLQQDQVRLFSYFGIRRLYIVFQLTSRREHILRNHSSDSKYKTTKAVVTVFNHQEIKGLWDVLKTEGNIHTEENWYRIVDAVRDQKGEHPMDRSMIQGPYNRKLEDVMREVSDAPRSVLNDISLRDCGVDFGSLGPDQNMAVCRTWARQGKRYIAPRQSINPQVAAEREGYPTGSANPLTYTVSDELNSYGNELNIFGNEFNSFNNELSGFDNELDNLDIGVALFKLWLGVLLTIIYPSYLGTDSRLCQGTHACFGAFSTEPPLLLIPCFIVRRVG